MSGRRSKNKGSRTELEFSKLTGGYKIPLSGALGGVFKGDVEALNLRWECKARKDGFKQIYTWLNGVDAVALKAGRS